ncbi:MAG TPA: hypothetical protein VME44_07315 [Streptosporangiaceae bacterium]|nr:hypothetical protein [Streptosporangiaceae bacterium]
MVSNYPGVVLICWEHDHIPALASSLPAVPGSVIPQGVARRPLRCRLGLHAGSGIQPAQHAFGQIPQQVLPGDTGTIIPP